mmetsp:Transcript_22850/g.73475  ORF Transcript_22850/g.73475 Transcript_22850/m.73475 type:complete len:274 (-) Transcript_22850:656-1477(-)
MAPRILLFPFSRSRREEGRGKEGARRGMLHCFSARGAGSDASLAQFPGEGLFCGRLYVVAPWLVLVVVDDVDFDVVEANGVRLADEREGAGRGGGEEVLCLISLVVFFFVVSIPWRRKGAYCRVVGVRGGVENLLSPVRVAVLGGGGEFDAAREVVAVAVGVEVDGEEAEEGRDRRERDVGKIEGGVVDAARVFAGDVVQVEGSHEGGLGEELVLAALEPLGLPEVVVRLLPGVGLAETEEVEAVRRAQVVCEGVEVGHGIRPVLEAGVAFVS